MNLQELATLVRDMRTEQKSYFKYRTPDHLQNSKKLEKLVDAAVAEILGDDGKDAKSCVSAEHPKLF